MSIKQEIVKILTHSATLRESVYVFARKVIYYFIWLEDDTQSQSYKVGYASARSPLGKLENTNINIVIKPYAEMGIYATVHNSILQIPLKDERTFFKTL